MKSKRIILKHGREKSLHRRHPWVFSGGIEKVEGNPAPGETVDVFAADGRFMAIAAYSPKSQIRARVWSFDTNEKTGADFFNRKIKAADTARLLAKFEHSGTNAYRFVFSESDGIPGLIADRYGDIAVLQLLSAGAEFFKKEIVDAVMQLPWCNAAYERSDADVRDVEGLQLSTGALAGAPPENGLAEIMENGLRFYVDIINGHKTGFYLDQRDSRKRFSGFAEGADVLNCFSYTGGFAVAALAGGANSVVSIDSSAPAHEMAKKNTALNEMPQEKCEWLCADAFESMRSMASEKKQFDLIALDPPKFAAAKGQLGKAERAYKDINMQAFKLLRPGGVLFTFSCSGAVSAEDFHKYVSWGAMDAGATAAVIGRLTQPADHPVLLSFPESEYLKGLIIRKY